MYHGIAPPDGEAADCPTRSQPKVSPVEVVTATLERIERANPVLNAFAAVDVQGALSEARKLEEAIAAGGPVGLLAGIPGGSRTSKTWPVW